MVQKKSIKKAIILAGGRGERLKPLTDKLPKILLPLCNRPFCFYQIEWLRKYGIKEIIFALGYLADKAKKELDRLKKIGLKINYVIEDTPLDTAGAIRYSCKIKKINEDFVVVNGDTLTNIDLSSIIKFHYQNKSLITLALMKVKYFFPYGIIKLEKNGKIKKFIEKPQKKLSFIVNAGVYVIHPKIVNCIPEGKYSLEKDLIPTLIKKNINIFGILASGYWLDIGTYERYLQAQEDIKNII